MANYLDMKKAQQVIALLALNWTFRRIERETQVRRETVSRYAKLAGSNAAKVFPGSDRPPHQRRSPAWPRKPIARR